MAGYRVLRQLGNGDRAQVLLATADGDSDAPTCALRVYPPDADEGALTREIEAMSDARCRAIPAMLDLATLEDGTICLAVERLDGPPLAQVLQAHPRSLGEAVTILAPIAAAMAELAEVGFTHTRLGVADVRLDASGRPRLIGLGALEILLASGPRRVEARRSAHGAFAALIDQVATCVGQPAQLSELANWIRDRADERPYSLTEEEIERRLFGLAASRPIRLDVAAESLELRGRVGAAAPLDAVHTHRDVDTVGLWARLARALPFRAGSSGGRPSLVGVRGAIRQFVDARRRPLIVGAIAGGLLLVLLLIALPPNAARDRSAVAALAGTHDRSPTAATATHDTYPDAHNPSESGQAAAAPTTGAVDGGDVVVAATELLTRRAECFAVLDPNCVRQYAQPGSAAETDDRRLIQRLRDGEQVSDDIGTGATTLVSDMGGACLLNVERPGREPASLLVVRSEAGWLIREVFD